MTCSLSGSFQVDILHFDELIPGLYLSEPDREKREWEGFLGLLDQALPEIGEWETLENPLENAFIDDFKAPCCWYCSTKDFQKLLVKYQRRREGHDDDDE
jgi:hypothetical protein